jgi:hypothetical protein
MFPKVRERVDMYQTNQDVECIQQEEVLVVSREYTTTECELFANFC